MRLGNLFTVRLPIDEVWKALLDIERIAPCVPGARLTEVAGDELRGVLKVRVGAAVGEFRGSLRLAEVDDAGRRIVVRARGVEAREQSAASATVTAVLTATGEGTSVSIETDLAIGGKLSQFGSGVMTDVSAALVKQFGLRLEAELGRPPPAVEAPPAPKADLPPGSATAVNAPAITAPAITAPAITAPAITAPDRRPQYWLPAGLIGVLATMAVVERRRSRWALAAIGVGFVVASHRSSSVTYPGSGS